MSKSTDIKKARGAKSSEVSTWQLLLAWWAHHRSSCVDSLSRLLSSPLQSLLTWLVIAIAIALPASLYLGLNNIQQLGQGWQDNAQMSAFLKQGAREAAVERLQKQLKDRKDIDRVEVVTPSLALQEFQQYSGLGDVLTDLDENREGQIQTSRLVQASCRALRSGSFRRPIEAIGGQCVGQVSLQWLLIQYCWQVKASPFDFVHR